MLHTIVGKRGKGKTSLAAELIVSQKRDQIFIYDYLGEFRDFAIKDYIFVESNTTNFSRFLVDVWNRSAMGISTLLILEEIAVYGKNNPQIDHIYRVGRHKGIDVVAISQRFYTLPVIVRSLTDIFHVFQITEQRDTQYLSNYVTDSVLNTIMRLPPFNYVDIDLNG